MRLTVCGGAIVSALLLVGCASAPKETQPDDQISYKRTDKFDKVWIADGFDFSGYETIFVTPITSVITPKDDKERYRLETAQDLIFKDLVHNLEAKQVVPSVVTKESDLREGARALRLDNRITEFSAGSIAARVMVGFGAGTPHLRLRGQISDATTGKVLLIYDIDERSPILFGHYQSTGSLQTITVLDIVKDISEFLSQVAKHEQIKYRNL